MPRKFNELRAKMSRTAQIQSEEMAHAILAQRPLKEQHPHRSIDELVARMTPENSNEDFGDLEGGWPSPEPPHKKTP